MRDRQAPSTCVMNLRDDYFFRGSANIFRCPEVVQPNAIPVIAQPEIASPRASESTAPSYAPAQDIVEFHAPVRNPGNHDFKFQIFKFQISKRWRGWVRVE
jgi:hypothetical protein